MLFRCLPFFFFFFSNWRALFFFFPLDGDLSLWLVRRDGDPALEGCVVGRGIILVGCFLPFLYEITLLALGGHRVFTAFFSVSF